MIVAKQKMCRFWVNPSDLGSQISRSLVKFIKTYPGIGWVRGDRIPDEAALKSYLNFADILRISKLKFKRCVSAVQKVRRSYAGNERTNSKFIFHLSHHTTNGPIMAKGIDTASQLSGIQYSRQSRR